MLWTQMIADCWLERLFVLIISVYVGRVTVAIESSNTAQQHRLVWIFFYLDTQDIWQYLVERSLLRAV